MAAFPEDVRRFIKRNITSVEQMEVLLLLLHNPEKDWTSEAVSRQLCTQPAAAAKRLADLESHGLISGRDGAERLYRYTTHTPARERLINRVAKVYKEWRVAVINLIYSSPQTTP